MTVRPWTDASPPRDIRSGSAEPLSFAQEGIWLADQLRPDEAACTIPVVVRLRGPLDVTALAHALDDVVARHEMLRTVVHAPDGVPVQEVRPYSPPLLSTMDLSRLPAAERLPAALTDVRGSVSRRLDLAEGPLRARLYGLGPEDNLLFLAVHHIVWDGWSAGVFYRDLTAFYRGHAHGEDVELPELPERYVGYASRQRAETSAERLDEDLAYWRDELGTGLAPLELPASGPSFTPDGPAAGLAEHTIPAHDAARLDAFARGKRVSMFMLLATALHAVLHRLTGATSVTTSFVSSNRDRAEYENLIGLFVNRLVLRTDSTENLTFEELLGQVRAKTLRAFRHADLPYERLVRELWSDAEREVVGQVQVGFQRETGSSQLNLPGVTAKMIELHNEASRESINLLASAESGSLELAAVYNTARLDQLTATRLLRRVALVLMAGTAEPTCRLADLPVLVDGEEAELRRLSAAEEPAGEPDTLHDLVFAQIARTPAADALVGDGQVVSYRELGERVDRLVRMLAAHGVRPGDSVGVRLERSVDFVVAALAVLGAGAHYLPVDPSLPDARTELMLQDTGSVLVICAETPTAPLPCPVLRLAPGAWWAGDDHEPGDLTRPEAHWEDVAYVLYTSGSTGTPKGVQVPHRGVVNVVRHHQQVMPLRPGDRLLHNCPLGFDISVVQLFWPLAVGAAVVIATPDMTFDLRGMAEYAAAERVTVMYTVPTVLGRYLAEQPPELPELRAVFVAGEVLPPDLVRRVRQYAPVPVFNGYGPTETAIVSLMWIVGPEDQLPSVLPIGRPFPGVRCHVLDDLRRQVPLGVPGELYLGGECVSPSAGYLGRPGLTAERYVADPYGAAGERLYRTGDLVRMGSDGTLFFLSRTDRQLKLHGVRLEPGEVQAAVTERPEVAEAYLTVRDDRLVAYVVAAPGRTVNEQALRAAVASQLPRQLVPSRFIELNRLPLTPNGKLDEDSLPDPATTAPHRTEYTAPRSVVEETVAEVWSEVLGVDRVGVHDDFFDLGGHSLLAIRLITRLREVLGAEVVVRDLFTTPTLGGLSAVIDAARRVAEMPLVPRVGGGPVELSFAQSRLWFLEQLTPDSVQYSVPLALRVRGDLDVTALEEAFSGVVARHEVLRTRFVMTDGLPVQEIIDPWPVAARHVTAADETEAQKAVQGEMDTPFDLAAGPLLRVLVVQLANDDHMLVVNMHHIVTDAWSLDVLVHELNELYPAAKTGQKPNLPELPVQYTDYAIWQRSRLQGSVLDEQVAYWRETLSGVEPLELPTDRPRPAQRSGAGGAGAFTVPAETARRLRDVAREHGSSLFMVGMTALQMLLTRYTGQTDIAVGTPITGRNRTEVEELIGFFLNTLVIRGDLTGNPTFTDLLNQTRKVTLDAFDHQDLPFEHLVEELAPERDLSRTPLFQVMFVQQNAPDTNWQLPGLDIKPMPTGSGVEKFDLTVIMTDTNDSLTVTLSYNTDLFNQTTVDRLAGHFQTVLTNVATHPEVRLSDLELLSDTEKHQLLHDWNNTGHQQRDEPLTQLFEAQVARTPDVNAVIYQDQVVTYRELNIRANRIAHRLIGLGVGPEQIVALAVPQSIDLIAALMGILKTGAAYLPIDVGFPADRIRFMIEDAGAMAVLTTTDAESALPDEPAHRVLLDDPASAAVTGTFPSVDPVDADRHRPITPADPTCVMYTSGSTGRPKGVALLSGALANLTFWNRARTPGRPGRRVAQFANITFDVSAEEILSALLHGKCLVVPPQEIRVDAARLVGWLAQHEVQDLFGPNLMLEELYRAANASGAVLPALRSISQGGELHVPREAAREFHARHPECRLYNRYGPTETHVCATTYPLPRDVSDWPSAPPIGRPVANTRVYVVDRFGKPTPIGVPGELWIGGPGVARGYLNRPELTTERFTTDPFTTNPTARIYRTGDQVRWLPNGNLEFLNRIDHQIKIRGYRIEPGEIESTLLTHPAITSCVVTPHDDPTGGKRLIAYYLTTNQQPNTTDLREWCAQTLPDYMIPARFIHLTTLPTTPSGKINRNALPQPHNNRPELHHTYTPPRTELEHTITTIWTELLNINNIGIHDNFFALGGHSLLAIRTTTRLQETTGMDVSVRMVFEAPTPARLARSLVIGDVRNAFDPVYPIRESGSSEPLFCLPAGSGLAWTYSGLMRVLDPEIPIYGLQSSALAKHRRRPASLEAVAAEYVSRIREVRPHGPYRLLGWSFGGVLAHAVAVRLQASGERVELLAVLDVDLVPNPDLMGKPVPEEFLRYRDDADDAGIEGLTVGDPGESAALGVLTTEEQSIVANARRYHREIRSRHAGGVFDGDLLFVLATADKSPIVPAEQIWRPFVTGNITELHVDCTHYELLDMAALARPDQPASGAAIEQVGAALNKVLTSD